MTVPQLLSAYTSSKLPTPPFLLLMTSLICTQEEPGTLHARSTTLRLFLLSLLFLPVVMSQLLAKIHFSVILCTPVIICLLSPASSIFLSLMDSSNQQCLNNNKKNPNILYQTVLCSALRERLIYTPVLHFLLPIFFPTIPLRHSDPLELSFPSYSESPTVTPSGPSSSGPLS